MSKKLFSLLLFMAFYLYGKAAVITTDLAPDSVKALSGAGTSWFPLDLNADGTEDFNISWKTRTRFGSSTTSFYLYGPAANEAAVKPSSVITIVIDSNSSVSSALTWRTVDSSATSRTEMTGFNDAGDKFVGVRFKIGTNTHYGWIHLRYTSFFELTIMSFAYESTADVSIQTPAPVLRPAADFSSAATTADTKTAVTFTDASTNSPTAWEWMFTPATVTYTGGTGASSQNPQVLFGAAGKYTVKLKATNSAGSDSITKTDYIIVYTTPAADFTASTVSTDTKTTVTFTETCTGDPTNMEWTFTPATVTYMAGTGSKSKNPQVTFNAVGKYTVSLKASNAAGTDTEVKTNYVTVSDAPTGIGAYSAEGKGLRVYPNPASKTLVIEQPDADATIDILDLGGKAELSRPLKGKRTELDISRLPKGYHILQLTSPKGVSKQKLLIE